MPIFTFRPLPGQLDNRITLQFNGLGHVAERPNRSSYAKNIEKIMIIGPTHLKTLPIELEKRHVEQTILPKSLKSAAH